MMVPAGRFVLSPSAMGFVNLRTPPGARHGHLVVDCSFFWASGGQTYLPTTTWHACLPTMLCGRCCQHACGTAAGIYIILHRHLVVGSIFAAGRCSRKDLFVQIFGHGVHHVRPVDGSLRRHGSSTRAGGRWQTPDAAICCSIWKLTLLFFPPHRFLSLQAWATSIFKHAGTWAVIHDLLLRPWYMVHGTPGSPPFLSALFVQIFCGRTAGSGQAPVSALPTICRCFALRRGAVCRPCRA